MVTMRSSLPSPFTSAAMADGAIPRDEGLRRWKVPSPLPSRTYGVMKLGRGKVELAVGVEVGDREGIGGNAESRGSWNVPSPLPGHAHNLSRRRAMSSLPSPSKSASVADEELDV